MLAGPFTSQHEREEGSKEPPHPETARNPQEVTCQRVQRGRAMTCPNPPPNLTGPTSSSPCFNGLSGSGYKGAPLKDPQVRKQASVG